MKRPKKVDSLIVGGGLIGLELLTKLEASGQKVFLIESSNELGGTSTNINLEEKSIKLNSLLWSKDESQSFTTLTLGKKGLTPFLGFGEKKINALEIAEDFTHENSRPIQSIPFNFDSVESFKTLTQATKVTLNQEGKHFCELNGKDNIEFEKLYWTAPMSELLKVLGKDSFAELKQKESKAKRFDGMTIQFEGDLELFKEHQNSKFILFGEDETPWMGALIEGDLLSFTTFYSHTLSQDHDFIRRHLKSLKRQVRKIFPDLYSEDQISLFSTDKLTLHNNVASLLNLSPKAQKELEPIEFMGSHKGHYPSPFHSKRAKIHSFDLREDSDSSSKVDSKTEAETEFSETQNLL